jgi:hypothetical protein
MKPNRVDTVQQQRDLEDKQREDRIKAARDAAQSGESTKNKKSEKQQHAKSGAATGKSHERQEASTS